MQFLCNSKIRPGVTREQVIEEFSKGVTEEDWKLVKKGVIAHWLWKTGDQPGLVIVMNGESLEEIRAITESMSEVKSGLIEYDIDPVSPFRTFD